MLEQNGWAGKIVPVLVFNRLEVFLACNRAVPDAVIARLNAAFVALEHEGVMQRIERAYDHWSVRQKQVRVAPDDTGAVARRDFDSRACRTMGPSPG